MAARNTKRHRLTSWSLLLAPTFLWQCQNQEQQPPVPSVPTTQGSSDSTNSCVGLGCDKKECIGLGCDEQKWIGMGCEKKDQIGPKEQPSTK
jgi:hypothetical protein